MLCNDKTKSIDNKTILQYQFFIKSINKGHLLPSAQLYFLIQATRFFVNYTISTCISMFAFKRQETNTTGKSKPFVSFVSGQTAKVVPVKEKAASAKFAIEQQMPSRSLAPAGRRRRRTATTKPRIVKGRVRVRVKGILHSLSAAEVLKKVPQNKLKLAVRKVASGSKRRRRRTGKGRRKTKKRKSKKRKKSKKKKKRKLKRTRGRSRFF